MEGLDSYEVIFNIQSFTHNMYNQTLTRQGVLWAMMLPHPQHGASSNLDSHAPTLDKHVVPADSFLPYHGNILLRHINAKMNAGEWTCVSSKFNFILWDIEVLWNFSCSSMNCTMVFTDEVGTLYPSWQITTI